MNEKESIETCGCGGQPVEIEGGIFCFDCCSQIRLPDVKVKGGPVEDLSPDLKQILKNSEVGDQ